MANIKSQIKRIRQTAVATEQNKGVRSTLKTLISKFNKAVAEKDKKKATDLFSQTSKALDKAASSGVIHANRAAGKKSTLSKQLKQLVS